ncbi:hypothetical protein RQP46_004997 [Phenoliferia psychrophenolica]
MSITHLTNLGELNSLLAAKKDKLVVIDFHASWCGPCHAIAPKFEQLSTAYRSQATFCKVDVDAAADIAKQYSVRAMPTFIFLKDGQKVDEVKGANAAALESALKRLTGAGGATGGASFPGAGHSLSGVAPPSTEGSSAKTYVYIALAVGLWWYLSSKYAAEPVAQ